MVCSLRLLYMLFSDGLVRILRSLDLTVWVPRLVWSRWCTNLIMLYGCFSIISIGYRTIQMV
uniref:Uncharacterized protein n=1 Tax=Anguilla anguilla TaxID=7936 RepID=A0A0E9WT38_ANGAN